MFESAENEKMSWSVHECMNNLSTWPAFNNGKELWKIREEQYEFSSKSPLIVGLARIMESSEFRQ